ncbi:MAG: hypothetical protein HYS68_01960 [Candidatus Levybacteria bacterium]|nr:hypothetical protein [Candidatus Levybacteria bacterium]
MSKLLEYSPRTDYRLPEISTTQKSPPRFNSYYAYYRVMGMSAGDFRLRIKNLPADATPEAILVRKREIVDQVCTENGIPDIESPNGYGFKRLKREIEAVSAPLVQRLKEKVPSDVLEIMVDNIAQRYSPDSAQAVQEAVQRIASMFQEMYSRAKHYGVLIPKDQQLLTFFTQVTERVFGEKTDPLNMFVVACPRYGEHDEYDTLEEGLSQTASTYLYSLPHLTSALTKSGIPYRGYVLVNDTEEQMADGSLLGRLGLTRETYRAKCRENVEAVKQAIAEDERITGVSAHLFTEVFPGFIDVTANLEKQLHHLTQSDSDLRLAMAKVADARLARHAKIMGGQCDFSDSLYLSLHYSAEYMALGYLLRLYPELSGDSFIINYNSPNVEQFNSQEVLVKCIRGDMSANRISTIPVFQVKYY